MRVGCVPTKYGYSAVALPPYDGDWELSTPIELSKDMLVQLRGQILHKLAIYCDSVKSHNCMILVIFWATWSALALGLGITHLWKVSPKYFFLYGWIRIFFFGNGLFLLGQSLAHIKSLVDMVRIREGAALGKWVRTTTEMPRRDQGRDDSDEEEYIQLTRVFYPETIPYYDEILREEPPWLFSAWPLGLTGWLRRMFIGPKTPRPGLIFELGELK